MFFLFSKLLYFLTQPINWIVMTLLAALFFKNKLWKKRLLRIGIFLLIFFTNHGIFNAIIHLWEPETLTANQIETPYDIAILLGGFSNFSIRPNHDRYNFSQSANRFTQTLELYKAGKVKQILVTGGAGSVLYKAPSEAIEIRKFMLQMGVAASDIIVESESRNTHENALFTKQILVEKHPHARCLLITSAFHLRRAKGCFKRQKVAFTPYAVDYMQEEVQWTPDFLLLPNSWTLMRWGLLTKEWVGYLAYWVRDYL